MRIAQFAPVFHTVPPVGYGGIERVVSILADGLTERGHNVTLFASGGSRTMARLISPLPEAPSLASPSTIHDEIYHTAAAYLHAFETDEFDIIHDHTLFGAGFGALLNHRPPVVSTLHNTWGKQARCWAALLGNREHRVAISKSQQSENPDVRYAGLVYNGIRTEDYPFSERKENFLLFVGRCSPVKAPELAVQVAKRSGLHLKLVVKKDEPLEQQHWEQSVERHLRGDEEIIEDPSHKRKVELFGRARALLFPIQWSEPFGLVMVEAMACGTPVVAFRRGAVAEVIDPGVTGYICDDMDEMVDAVKRAKNIDPKLCRLRAEEHFSASKMLTGYEHIYEGIMTNRPGK